MFCRGITVSSSSSITGNILLSGQCRVLSVVIITTLSLFRTQPANPVEPMGFLRASNIAAGSSLKPGTFFDSKTYFVFEAGRLTVM